MMEYQVSAAHLDYRYIRGASVCETRTLCMPRKEKHTQVKLDLLHRLDSGLAKDWPSHGSLTAVGGR